ncbi:MAG: ferric reductase-like transmembrane domain-containing protein [Eggerthellaceae bacterium]|nr:ferric reductase-like transmembrane domain-containing protein [Eggerthellaceae bacterium]
MDFLSVLIVTALLTYICQPAIKQFPAVLYLAAACLVALFLAAPYASFPGFLERALFFLIHKGTLALSLFCVVMFIGVLPHGASLRHRLAAIRAELSICACILVAGHMGLYLVSYLSRIGVHPVGPLVLTSLAIAIVLLVIVVALGITSIDSVKQRMGARAWSRLHKLAYVFFGLVFVHLALMLVPSAMAGSQESAVKMAAYAIIFGSYAALRLRLAVSEKKPESTSSYAKA